MKVGGSIGKIGNWAKDRVTPSKKKNDGGGPPPPKEWAQEAVDAGNAAVKNVDSQYATDSWAYQQKYGGAGGQDAQYVDIIQQSQQPVLNQLGGLTQPVNIDPAFRNYQMGLAQQLQNQAMGQGPSLAQMQLQQATDRTLNQSLGAIKSGMGGQNAALAARTASLASSQQLAGMGQQSGMLRLQEQQDAQNALAQLSAAGRGQDSSDALNTRDQQLGAIAQQSDAISRSLGGVIDVNRGRMGMEAAAQSDAAASRAADKANRQRKQDALIGAGINVLTGGLASGLTSSKKG